jgi:hypothetical protein
MLHGDPIRSFGQHWFGIPALFILIYRIIHLLNNFLINLYNSTQFQHGKRHTS